MSALSPASQPPSSPSPSTCTSASTASPHVGSDMMILRETRDLYDTITLPYIRSQAQPPECKTHALLHSATRMNITCYQLYINTSLADQNVCALDGICVIDPNQTRQPTLNSIRDLAGSDVVLLNDIRSTCTSVLLSRYPKLQSQSLMFAFQHPPSCNRLVIYINHASSSRFLLGSYHLLEDVRDGLEEHSGRDFKNPQASLRHYAQLPLSTKLDTKQGLGLLLHSELSRVNSIPVTNLCAMCNMAVPYPMHHDGNPKISICYPCVGRLNSILCIIQQIHKKTLVSPCPGFLPLTLMSRSPSASASSLSSTECSSILSAALESVNILVQLQVQAQKQAQAQGPPQQGLYHHKYTGGDTPPACVTCGIDTRSSMYDPNPKIEFICYYPICTTCCNDLVVYINHNKCRLIQGLVCGDSLYSAIHAMFPLSGTLMDRQMNNWFLLGE